MTNVLVNVECTRKLGAISKGTPAREGEKKNVLNQMKMYDTYT